MADVDDQIIVIAVGVAVVESELKAAVCVACEVELGRADEWLVVAELMERDGGSLWNENRMIRAVA